MRAYITIPRKVKKSELSKKRYSFQPKDYRTIKNKHRSFVQLQKLCQSYDQGQEIGSDKYMQKSKYRFLKTVNISRGFTLDETSVEYCAPLNIKHPKKGNLLIVKDGAGDGLGETCLYNLNNLNKTDSISAGVLCLQIPKDKLFYVLGVLKTQHFKDFLNLKTPEGTTIRHSKKLSLQYNVPFPSKRNNQEPDEVFKLVDLIVQNIIDKEEKIKEKNRIIDEMIESEIVENQKRGNFKYVPPTIMEIKRQRRLNTSLYTENYKAIEHKIKNYKNGFFFLDEKNISPGKTPEDYYLTDKHLKNTYLWVTPKSLSKRQLLFRTYIHTNKKTNTKKHSLIFTGIRYVGNCYFIEDDAEPIYCNQNTLIVNQFKELYEQVFPSVSI